MLTVASLLATFRHIGRSPLYTALTIVLSGISNGIGEQRRTFTKQPLLPVQFTCAPESITLDVVRSATSSDFGVLAGRLGSAAGSRAGADFFSTVTCVRTDFKSFFFAIVA